MDHQQCITINKPSHQQTSSPLQQPFSHHQVQIPASQTPTKTPRQIDACCIWHTKWQRFTLSTHCNSLQICPSTQETSKNHQNSLPNSNWLAFTAHPNKNTSHPVQWPYPHPAWLHWLLWRFSSWCGQGLVWGQLQPSTCCLAGAVPPPNQQCSCFRKQPVWLSY